MDNSRRLVDGHELLFALFPPVSGISGNAVVMSRRLAMREDYATVYRYDFRHFAADGADSLNEDIALPEFRWILFLHSSIAG